MRMACRLDSRTGFQMAGEWLKYQLTAPVDTGPMNCKFFGNKKKNSQLNSSQEGTPLAFMNFFFWRGVETAVGFQAFKVFASWNQKQTQKLFLAVCFQNSCCRAPGELESSSSAHRFSPIRFCNYLGLIICIALFLTREVLLDWQIRLSVTLIPPTKEGRSVFYKVTARPVS